jgi:hypothetical protein
MNSTEGSRQDRSAMIPANRATLLKLAKSPDATIELSKEQLAQMHEADERARRPHAAKR